MKKISVNHMFFYFLLAAVSSVTWGVLHFKEPNWNLTAPLLASIGLIWCLWFKRFSLHLWLGTFLSLISLSAIILSEGPQRGLIFILAESLLLLLWDQWTVLKNRYLYFLALTFITLVAFDMGDPLINSIGAAVFVTGRSLFWPSIEAEDYENEFLTLWFKAISVSIVLFLSGNQISNEALIAVSIAAMIAVAFGRPVGAIIASLFVLYKIEPTILIFVGPILLLLSAGSWGYRSASLVAVLLSIPVLAKTQLPEHIAALGIFAAALGFLWWTVRIRAVRWFDIGASVVVAGLSIFLNQEWFFNLSPVADPIEFSGAGAWVLGFVLGALLRNKFKSFSFPSWKLPRMKFSISLKAPSFNFPFRNFSNAFSGYYFFVVIVLIVTVAILWGAQPLYDSL